jgi:ubiquinol-cytochrome c reductase cytochrome b subunit
MLLPLLVGVLVVAHVILVRRHGVVPPFDAVPAARTAEAAAGEPNGHHGTEIIEAPPQRPEVTR